MILVEVLALAYLAMVIIRIIPTLLTATLTLVPLLQAKLEAKLLTVVPSLEAKLTLLEVI